MRYLFTLLLSIVLLHAQEDGYELGRGLQLGELPLYLGGYTSVKYKNDQRSETYSLDDVALMVYGSVENFSYMAEVEYKDLYVKQHTEFEDVQNSDNTLYIERLYLDYTYGENYLLRVGKYNSPIGFWNMLPINVLRETTSNPKTKEILYPQFTTGMGLSYSSYQAAEIKYDLMLQNNNDLDDKYNNYEIDQHFGAGITYTKNEYSFKVNGGYFHQIEAKLKENDRYYFLAGGKYETEKFSLMGEVGTQVSETRFTTPYAFYLQSTYKFNEQHSITCRIEGFEDNIDQSSNAHEEEYEEEEEDYSEEMLESEHSKTDLMAIFGYTYRPAYPVALKVEYQVHKLHSEDQFLASFSVLF